ncbi:hypothetical protein K2O51_22885 [Cupriavidus pinatubonensis]|uniref:hypothetical protein n=1 Tax=Cupriavidus pinatubonensis TaxID=248026 RepID=UPI001C73185D|nr:hypothetical protein [Cupriavidus pinatubonensis]QYY30221.1 hypothetical protein K2O51_22885 [Cupriavidus pinatubonensis]
MIGVAALAAAIFAVGWTANGWRKEAEIERVKTASTQDDLVSANKAIENIGMAIDTIRARADEFNVTQTALSAKVDAAVKEFRNAKKPLPLDCRPDDFRMRKLSDAVEAAKQAAAAR